MRIRNQVVIFTLLASLIIFALGRPIDFYSRTSQVVQTQNLISISTSELPNSKALPEQLATKLQSVLEGLGNSNLQSKLKAILLDQNMINLSERNLFIINELPKLQKTSLRLQEQDLLIAVENSNDQEILSYLQANQLSIKKALLFETELELDSSTETLALYSDLPENSPETPSEILLEFFQKTSEAKLYLKSADNTYKKITSKLTLDYVNSGIPLGENILFNDGEAANVIIPFETNIDPTTQQIGIQSDPRFATISYPQQFSGFVVIGLELGARFKVIGSLPIEISNSQVVTPTHTTAPTNIPTIAPTSVSTNIPTQMPTAATTPPIIEVTPQPTPPTTYWTPIPTPTATIPPQLPDLQTPNVNYPQTQECSQYVYFSGTADTSADEIRFYFNNSGQTHSTNIDKGNGYWSTGFNVYSDSYQTVEVRAYRYRDGRESSSQQVSFYISNWCSTPYPTPTYIPPTTITPTPTTTASTTPTTTSTPILTPTVTPTIVPVPKFEIISPDLPIKLSLHDVLGGNFVGRIPNDQLILKLKENNQLETPEENAGDEVGGEILIDKIQYYFDETDNSINIVEADLTEPLNEVLQLGSIVEDQFHSVLDIYLTLNQESEWNNKDLESASAITACVTNSSVNIRGESPARGFLDYYWETSPNIKIKEHEFESQFWRATIDRPENHASGATYLRVRTKSKSANKQIFSKFTQIDYNFSPDYCYVETPTPPVTPTPPPTLQPTVPPTIPPTTPPTPPPTEEPKKKGCMDPEACNYDEEAEEDDGSCDPDSCKGCTAMGACNYDETATKDDGSCEYESCICDPVIDPACLCDPETEDCGPRPTPKPKKPKRCAVLVVEGVDCNNTLYPIISAVNVEKADVGFANYGCTPNAETYGPRIAEGIQDIREKDAEDKQTTSIMVVSHSLGAIAAFNFRQSGVKYIFADSPYGIEYPWPSTIFSSHVRAIKKARDGGIASDPDHIAWSGEFNKAGQFVFNGKAKPKEAHTPWEYGRGDGGLSQRTREWIERYCVND
jgi:hypothetical protein